MVKNHNCNAKPMLSVYSTTPTQLRRREFVSVLAAGFTAALPLPVSAHQKETLLPDSGIDPNSMQFLFADLQSPLVKASKTQPPAQLEHAAATMAEIGKILAIPLVFSEIMEGTSLPHLLPSLSEYSTNANTVLRIPISPFHDPATVGLIDRHHRRTLAIAGFTAEIVVLQSALDAIAAGYSVYYVTDAIGSQSNRTEAAAFREMELAGAKPTSVLSLATRLISDLTGNPGKQVVAALQR